ncbi:hypothetical protein ABTF56_20665, partial [Acinetobacter baumannii]
MLNESGRNQASRTLHTALGLAGTVGAEVLATVAGDARKEIQLTCPPGRWNALRSAIAQAADDAIQAVQGWLALEAAP